MTSASVVMRLEPDDRLLPTRSTLRRSPMPAMPAETVQKMMGAISILMRLMKPSPNGFIAWPACGHSQPTRTPQAIATST